MRRLDHRGQALFVMTVRSGTVISLLHLHGVTQGVSSTAVPTQAFAMVRDLAPLLPRVASLDNHIDGANMDSIAAH